MTGSKIFGWAHRKQTKRTPAHERSHADLFSKPKKEKKIRKSPATTSTTAGPTPTDSRRQLSTHRRAPLPSRMRFHSISAPHPSPVKPNPAAPSLRTRLTGPHHPPPPLPRGPRPHPPTRGPPHAAGRGGSHARRPNSEARTKKRETKKKKREILFRRSRYKNLLLLINYFSTSIPLPFPLLFLSSPVLSAAAAAAACSSHPRLFPLRARRPLAGRRRKRRPSPEFVLAGSGSPQSMSVSGAVDVFLFSTDFRVGDWLRCLDRADPPACWIVLIRGREAD